MIGVFWVVCIFRHFVHFVDWLVPGSPYTKETDVLTAVLPYHISAFHTVFNVLNTMLMLPLINQLAKLTYLIIPKSKREDSTPSISTNGSETPLEDEIPRM